MIDACFYIGTVFHKRYIPKIHTLKYKVFCLFADLDDLAELSKKHLWFSFNKFNLLSFYETDYGNPKISPETRLKDKLLGLLQENSIDEKKVSSIKVLAYPRVLGFAFNPITVFYCYCKNGNPYAIIYEVRNTFSERHNYIFSIPEKGSFETTHQTKKRFHVSPFFDRTGDYTFSIKEPGEEVLVAIEYTKQSVIYLKACFSGTRQNITDKSILTSSFKMPFMTLKVILAILYEALKLKLKGLQVFKHPEDHVYQSSLAQVKTQNKSHKIQEDTE